MSRLADTILTGEFANVSPSAMVDIRRGGQMGYAPALGEWVNHTSYVARPLVVLLLEAPRGFQFMPDPAFMVGALKALMELHPKSISGFSRGLTAEFAETAVGGGGEMQEDVTNVTRARTQPSFTYVEKYGRPIQTFVEEWMINLMGDAESKIAMVNTFSGPTPTDMLGDMAGATILAFEPDPTHTTVLKAWLTTNMMPKGTGDITAKRDLTTAMEQNEFTLDFTGISQSSLGVRLFAQSLLDSINITNANPNLAPAFVQSVSSDVLAANTGYAIGAQSLGATAVASRP